MSWQITGVRRDAWAAANPFVVEDDKSADDRGLFLHPEAYGYGVDRGIRAARAMQAEAVLKANKPDPRASAAASPSWG